MAAGGDLGDLKRAMTPRRALDLGAALPVAGRSITGAADPTEAAREILADLAG